MMYSVTVHKQQRVALQKGLAGQHLFAEFMSSHAFAYCLVSPLAGMHAITLAARVLFDMWCYQAVLLGVVLGTSTWTGGLQQSVRAGHEIHAA